jgi:hypothetical protein
VCGNFKGEMSLSPRQARVLRTTFVTAGPNANGERVTGVNCDKEDLPKVVEHVANQGLELLHHLAKEIWCVPTY